jgi:serine O-acetyltransferase
MPDAEPVSATIADWGREKTPLLRWDPGRQLLGSIRAYQQWRRRFGPIGRIVAAICAVRHRFWSIVASADVPLNCQKLGGGLIMMHPNGIIIHPEASLGPNCMLFQQVTIGTRTGHPGLPRIGGHVDIGAGAKVLGPVVIGDHAQIGANAVVIIDVPAGGVAVGVPARVLSVRKSFDQAHR